MAQFIKLLRSNCFGKMPVPHHSFYIQILNRDIRWLGFHHLIDRFIDVISTDVIYPVMKLLYVQFLFLYILSLSELSFL